MVTRPFNVKLPPFLMSIAIAVAASAGLHYFGLVPKPMDSDRATVYGALAQVAGTMLGFMLAALAVLALTDPSGLMLGERGHDVNRQLVRFR